MNVPAVPEGFSLQSSGRSGSVFYRKGDRVLQLYCEMSGVPQYDMLLWVEDSGFWTFPEREMIEEAERRQILADLEAWLRLQNIRSDAFPDAAHDLPPIARRTIDGD